MNTPTKSEREIAASITESTYAADEALAEILGMLTSDEAIKACKDAIKQLADLRRTVASWLFDTDEHCHSCYEKANVVTYTCHVDSNLCMECLLAEKDQKAISFLLGGE
jgi:hypothetical protein